MRDQPRRQDAWRILDLEHLAECLHETVLAEAVLCACEQKAVKLTLGLFTTYTGSLYAIYTALHGGTAVCDEKPARSVTHVAVGFPHA